MVCSKISVHINNFLCHVTEYSDFLFFLQKSTNKLAENLTYFTDVLSTRKVQANLSNLLDEVESDNPDHVDKVLFFIYLLH